MVSKEKNLVVVKSNRLVEASYRLGLDEQRLLLACISQIDSTDDLTKKDEFTITVRQYVKLFPKVDSRNAYKQLKDASDSLFERKIDMKIPGERKGSRMRWVWKSSYDEDEGQVSIAFSPGLIPYVSQLKEQFTKYNIEHISHLTSVHAIRIYEMCLQYVTIGQRTIEIKALKDLLGLSDMYPDYKIFNRAVLKPTIKQIKDHTDIEIKITPQKKLRKIVSLKFEIEYKKARHVKLSNQKTNSELKKISSTLEIKPTHKNPKQQSIPSFILNN